MAVLACIWCTKELTKDESERGCLCSTCDQVATGVPGLSDEQLDRLPFGVIELDRCGTIISYNQTEERLSGLPKARIVGRNFFKVAPCADVKEFRGRFEAFLDGDNLSELFDFKYYFGTYVVDVQLTFLRVNKQVAFVLSRRMSR